MLVRIEKAIAQAIFLDFHHGMCPSVAAEHNGVHGH